MSVVYGFNEGTSPLEREILTHYWARSGDWKGDRTKWTSLDHDIVSRFLELELLQLDAPATHKDGWNYNLFKANREALEPYMRALAQVPLPVKRTEWIVP